MTRARRAWAALLVAASAAQGASAVNLLPPFGSAAGAPAAAWKLALLPHQAKPATQFRVVEDQGQFVLRVEAERSYGNLLHLLPPQAGARRLGWRWKVELLNEATDLTQRSGDDTTLKVCVLWDEPLDKLPFGDRQMLRMARAMAGEPLPAATVCYVWDAKLPEGSELASPFTQRLRYVVLRHGAGRGEWKAESRDIGADFLHFFGKEVSELPPLLGIAVGADADNTQGHSIGQVGDLLLEPR